MSQPELHRSEGLLLVEPSKVYVLVDPGIVALARALVPQPLRSRLLPQRYPGHITVVRNEPFQAVSVPREVTFEYDPEPVVGDVYTWLRVLSPELTEVRRLFGLQPSSPWSRPPDDEDVFHVTIGNRKTV